MQTSVRTTGGRQQTNHPNYGTSDIWQAAWLLAMGCQLIKVQPDSGNARWLFDNTPDGEAFRLGVEFRTEGIAVCPVLELRAAYRYAARVANEARKGIHTNDDRNDH